MRTSKKPRSLYAPPRKKVKVVSPNRRSFQWVRRPGVAGNGALVGCCATTTAAGCDASTVTVADLTGLSEELGANGGDHTFAVEVSMSNDATDECQGATFELNYTAHGASS